MPTVEELLDPTPPPPKPKRRKNRMRADGARYPGLAFFDKRRTHISKNDRYRIRVAIGLGLTLEEVATLIIDTRTGRPISAAMLAECFPDEIEQGKAYVKARVAGTLFRRATDPNDPQGVRAAIHITRTRMAWKEPPRDVVVDVSGKSGVLVAPGAVSPEEWIREQAAADAARSKPGDDDD